MDQLFESANSDKIVAKERDEDFDIFWKAYPSSDQYKHWPKTRSFKIGERKARQEYTKILLEGKYSSDQILKALQNEISMRERTSIKENICRYRCNNCRKFPSESSTIWNEFS